METYEYPGLKGGTLHVTMSVGVASCPDHSIKQDELIEKADIALYASKESGRNRCTLYSPELQMKKTGGNK